MARIRAEKQTAGQGACAMPASRRNDPATGNAVVSSCIRTVTVGPGLSPGLLSSLPHKTRGGVLVMETDVWSVLPEGRFRPSRRIGRERSRAPRFPGIPPVGTFTPP